MIMFSWKSACILMLIIGVELNFSGAIMAQRLTSPPRSIFTALSASKLAEEEQRYFETQEYELAIASFLALLKIEPDNVRAYNTLGMSFGGLKKYSAAIAAFDRAIALDNNFANAYYNRGYVYQQLGNYNLALIDFDRALMLTDKKHISALINRASVYLNDLAIAEKLYRQAGDISGLTQIKRIRNLY